ncbi:methionyl-tRNA synthetase [Pseudozyma hubeiensis SY62]|uniref:Probable methionine--tRNA ligase, mitochondrial n=1 Tax=Pseudozyma hubeiensis (strain SY62) TaxID=1305764 RepID=R9NX01_PSEHS|nr:methionyl-tRNA synthetase [Pseudozyma hubeiensis SY62]GAC93163.1 methionyl-tRNA synthetase [Pseudozyma hubeiensis SY62]
MFARCARSTSAPSPWLSSTARKLRPLPSPYVPRRQPLASRSITSQADVSSSSSAPEPKPYFVTTPIFYVNADPHIGHLYSDVIADVLARYHGYMRSGHSRHDRSGELVPDSDAPSIIITPLLSTGTDEHGLKVQKVAEAAGEDPRSLCDRISQRFKQLADASNINYTRFIRTTDPDHKLAVEHLWRVLRDRGHIYQGSHEGWYAVSDEAFYPESQTKSVVDKDGNEVRQSIETGAKVEWSQEVNYKFRLSEFQQPLLDWLRANPKSIQPRQKWEEVVAEVEGGLMDLSISRPSSRLSWGIRVPDDEEHSIYVWVDALTNYLTVAGYPFSSSSAQDEGNLAWPADVHVVGKDIVRFHAIYWPAMLLAAGLPPPKTILAHSHWTMGKAKMSKSRGNVANPFDAIEMFGLDALRYFLMRVGGNFGSDSDYNPAVLVEYHRKYLQGQLGNLVSRICAPKIHARLDDFPRDEITGVLARPSLEQVESHLDEETLSMCRALESALIELPSRVDSLMQEYEVGKVLELILEDTIASTNELIQRLQPWSTQTHPVVVLESIILVTESLRISALLLTPFMPDKMAALLDTLRIPEAKRKHPKDLLVRDDSGRLVSHVLQRGVGEGKPQPLFPRIELA